LLQVLYQETIGAHAEIKKKDKELAMLERRLEMKEKLT